MEPDNKPSIPDVNTFSNKMDKSVFASILPRYSKTGEKNKIYYVTVFENWANARVNEFKESNQFQSKTNWMIDFLNIFCKKLVLITVQIAKGAYSKYKNEPKWNAHYEGGYFKLFRFLDYGSGHVNTIESALISLKLNWDENPVLAVKMQSYCMDRIEELKRIVEIQFFIKKGNPIFIWYDEIVRRLKDKIDIRTTEVILNNSRIQTKNLDEDYLTKKSPFSNSIKGRAKEVQDFKTDQKLNPNPKISIRNHTKELKNSQEYFAAKISGGIPFEMGEEVFIVKSIGLAAILASNEVQGLDLTTQKKVVFNGVRYYGALMKGYKEGQDYFLTTFKNNQFQSRETIVDDLQLKYYHDSKTSIKWVHYLNEYPLVIDYDIIKRWGYYQGILNELENIIDENPTLFKDFHKLNATSTNDEPDINRYIECIRPSYEHYIDFKVDGEPNPDYWYDINQDFCKIVLSDGGSKDFFNEHQAFLDEFSHCIQHLGETIHQMFIAAWKYSKEPKASKRKSEKTRFNIAYSELEMKTHNLSTTLTYLKKISIDNEASALKAAKFCDYYLDKFKDIFLEMGIDFSSIKKIQNAVSLDELKIFENQRVKTENADKGRYIPKKTTLPHKYYSLAYYLIIKANGQHLPTDSNGTLSQKQLRKIGRKFLAKHKIESTGQQFAKSMKDIDLKNITKRRMFPSDWLDKILPIVKDDKTAVDFINEKYSNTQD